MATYLYRCECMNEVEVSQPMSEDTFTNCLQIYERLGQPAPAECSDRGGCPAERLIAGTAGVISKGSSMSCSLGDRASACGGGCGSGGGGGCPFG